MIPIPGLGRITVGTDQKQIFDLLRDQYPDFKSAPKRILLSVNMRIQMTDDYDLYNTEAGFELAVPLPLNLALIEGHIKMALGRQLLKDKLGMVIHSCCLNRNGMASLFAAPSGTGKSTVLHNSPHYEPLNDDNTIVFLNKGRFLAAGSPFNETVSIPKRDECIPVAKIYFIYQAGDDILNSLPEAMAVKYLLKNFLAHRPKNLSESKQIMVNAIELFELFFKQVHGYRLGLLNSGSFWQTIYAEERKIHH